MITINTKRYRSFYPQTGVSWGANLLPQSINNSFSFSFSGSSGTCNIFNFVGNKIFSPDNLLIGSYSQNQSLYFSGNVGTQTADLYLNSFPLYLGLPVKNNQVLSGVYLNSSNGAPINLVNLTVNGQTTAPYSTTNSYNLSYGQSFVPVNFVNSGSYPVIIFSGSSSNRNYVITGTFPLLSVAPGKTGIFNLTNTGLFDLSLLSSNIPITLSTNLGVLTGQVNAIGGSIPLGSSFINLIPEVTLLPSGGANIVTLVMLNNSGSALNVSLKYVSGYTGVVYNPVQVTQYYTENINGTITGAAYFVKYVSSPTTGAGLPPYYITQYNSLLGANETTVASGILTSDIIYAPDMAVAGTVILNSSGIGDLYTGFNGQIFNGKITGSGITDVIPSYGYTNYITGGILTGYLSPDMPLYTNFFGQALSGIYQSGVTLYSVYQPSNYIYSPLSVSQYTSQVLSATNSAYIVGSFLGLWSTTGIASVTGVLGTGNTTGTISIPITITGAYPYTITSQSQSGSYSVTNAKVSGFFPASTFVSYNSLNNNLLQYNNSFTVGNAWFYSNVNTGLSTGVAGPFVRTSGIQFQSSGDRGGYSQSVLLASGTQYTFSVYAKYISGDSRIYVSRDGYAGIYDLVAATGSNSPGASSTITPITNGWYNVASTWLENIGGNQNVSIYAYRSGSAFQIFNAQLLSYSNLYSAYDQYVTGIITKTFNPIGSYTFYNTFTGYFYSPSYPNANSIYFNESITSVGTGIGFITHTSTKNVYVVIDPTAIAACSGQINSNPYIQQFIYYPITGLISASLTGTISGAIINLNVPITITGMTTNGYYSEINSKYVTTTGTSVGQISASCTDSNGNIFYLNDGRSFSVTGNVTGNYSGLLASTIDGSWPVAGILTGMLYQYQGIRTYTGNWTLSSGSTIVNLNYLANSGTTSYNSILGTGVGYKYPYVSQLLVGYNDMFSVSLNNAGLSGYYPGYDIVKLTVTGANFTGIGRGSGLNLLLSGVGAV